jgi:nitroreductase
LSACDSTPLDRDASAIQQRIQDKEYSMAQKLLINTIFSRRSIRSYSSEPVSEKNIQTLLEAAMAAPSASNLKPWHFVAITKRDTLDRLAEAHPFGKMLFEAPLCIAVCGDVTVSESYWVQDCSAAAENLLIAAVALDLGAVWLGVYPRDERVNTIREILGMPARVIPLNLVAIGHPAEDKPARTQYEGARVHRERW